MWQILYNKYYVHMFYSSGALYVVPMCVHQCTLYVAPYLYQEFIISEMNSCLYIVLLFFLFFRQHHTTKMIIMSMIAAINPPTTPPTIAPVLSSSLVSPVSVNVCNLGFNSAY